MPIFQITPNELKALVPTSFGVEGILERKDLQRLLRSQISIFSERLMVVAEEFGDWIDSTRRIDLLCLDSDANLVIVELKRNEDGGHMELQALRYAAMVSAMTFEQLIETFARYKSISQPNVEAAKSEILQFLDWDTVYEEQFARDTRIILAAADFGKELTTTVMWLIERNIDIRCVRMKPYRMDDGALLVDVQQLIPLPEATAFQTQIGVKKQAERQNLSGRHLDRIAFWERLLEHAKTISEVHANRRPTTDNWISGSIGRSGFGLNYVVRESSSQVELWIAFGSGQTAKNKAAFKALENERREIEAEFGEHLEWHELPEREGSRIRYLVDGGYRSPQESWPIIVASLADAMAKLDKAFRSRVGRLKL